MGGSGVKRASGCLLLAGALLLVGPGSARGQTVFPSDGEDPRKPGGWELMEVVCPGRVATGKTMQCRTGCPEYTGFRQFDDKSFTRSFDWSLMRVTRGHFLSPTSEDAALWMEGCEAHSMNFGGTILLTRKADRWVKVCYRAGLPTNQCHKLALQGGREILVCMGSYGAQGHVWTALYVENLLHPIDVLMMVGGGNGHFFEVLDDTLTCGEDQGAIRNRIQSPERISRRLTSRVATEAAERHCRSRRPSASDG